MMQSSNLDHHLQHQEDQLHGGSSSSLPSLSFHHLLGSNHEWNQTVIGNGINFIPNICGVLSAGTIDLGASNENSSPTLNTPMVQELGFHWGGNADSYMNHSANEPTLARIKDELSEFYPKFNGIIRNHHSIEDCHLPSTSCIKHKQQGQQELHEGLSFDVEPSLACFRTGEGACRRGNNSTVLPSANISSMNPPSSLLPVSLGMDLQALDLLASARFGRSFCENSFNTSMAFLREDVPFGLTHLQEPSNSHHNPSTFVSGVAESKRGNNYLENKACQSAPKKPRLETRSSFSPFKVRKEKLGDRIAALQQLVAPFGKTDTASVLMEAIGYIKFLQDQVQTLSVPYIRSSSNQKLRTIQGASIGDGDEMKPDLRSRGLCLVPLSCTSYVTSENGGIWSPPNYRGSN